MFAFIPQHCWVPDSDWSELLDHMFISYLGKKSPVSGITGKLQESIQNRGLDGFSVAGTLCVSYCEES